MAAFQRLGLLLVLARPETNVPSIAVGVVSSDKRFDTLGRAALSTWAGGLVNAIVYVDSAAKVTEVQRRLAPSEARRVARCCGDNERLGDTLAGAQEKLLPVISDLSSRFPAADFHLYTDDDTVWNTPLLRRLLVDLAGKVPGEKPTAFFQGSPKRQRCDALGPFMLMNGALGRLLANRSLQEQCVAFTKACYAQYRTGTPGACPPETFRFKQPYPGAEVVQAIFRALASHARLSAGAAYNNDHVINVCVNAKGILRESVDMHCMENGGGVTFAFAWPYCGVDSKFRPSQRQKYCFGACWPWRNQPNQCTEKALTLRNMPVLSLPPQAAPHPLVLYNDNRVSPQYLLGALVSAERRTFGTNGTRALNVFRRILGYHHASRPEHFHYFHRCQSPGADSAACIDEALSFAPEVVSTAQAVTSGPSQRGGGSRAAGEARRHAAAHRRAKPGRTPAGTG